MFAVQMPLPTIDMRPICPVCRQPADLLAQWSPAQATRVCKACAQKYRYDLDIFIHAPGKGRLGLKSNRDASTEQIGHYNFLSQTLMDAAKGCRHAIRRLAGPEYVAPCELYKFDMTCPACVRKQKHATRYARMRITREYTLRLPVCDRCGCTHSRRYEHGDQDFIAYCQHCEDELNVETFWRCRAIFGDADPEEILDRVQKSHPGLFERNVLPNYWFALMIGERNDGN